MDNPTVTPVDPINPVDKSSGEHKFTWVEDYLKLPREPQKWLVKDLLPAGGITHCYAEPKVGKTFLLMGLGAAICNGDDEWEGFEVFRQGRVMFLEIDTPREEMADRFLKMAIKDGMFAIADMWQVPQYPFDINSPMCFKWLKEQAEMIKPVLAVVDTIREVHGEDEDKSTAMRGVVGKIIQALRPATIALIGHSRKEANQMFNPTGDTNIMSEGRGSNYVAGKADVIIRLTKKRMTYKGRATGEMRLPIEQDKETGFISVHWPDDNPDIKLVREVMKLHPGESVNKMAERISKLGKMSVSTATRRIKLVKEQEAKSASVVV